MPDRPLGEREAATELANGRIGIDQFREFGAQRGVGHGRSLLDIRAFSNEVDSGSRKENASKQETRVPFRFNRNGKGSSVLNLKFGGLQIDSMIADSPDFG